MTGNFAGTYDLCRPVRWRGGVIFASPHSGRDYPDWFLGESQLDLRTLRSSEDAFIDRLIRPALDHGAVVLSARVPRALVDLNRGTDEIDPRAVAGTVAGRATPRVLSGLGVIPRVVARGQAIRRLPLTRAEAGRRIDAYWRPYHAALHALMDEAVARFGQAILIDVHSMPREALSHLPGRRPDLVMGDRNGMAAARWLSLDVAAAIEAAGFTMRANSPFAGAHILAVHGRPAQNRHAVQIEIDRSLYMDETQVCPHDGFDGFAGRFAGLIARLVDAGGTRARPDLAAE